MTPEENNHPKLNFDYITGIVKEEVLKNGYYNPSMIIEGTKGALFRSIPVFSDTPVESMQAMRVAGRQEAKSGEVGQIYQGFVMGKAWMNMPKDSESIKTLPSQNPNCKEVFVVSRLKIQGQVKNVKLFEMIRNDQGKLVDLQEFLPSMKAGEMAYVPLLEAFYEGFQNAFRERWN